VAYTVASAGGEESGLMGATVGTWGVRGASALRLAQIHVPSLRVEASGAPSLLVLLRGPDQGPAVPGEPLRRFPGGGGFPFEKFFGNFIFFFLSFLFPSPPLRSSISSLWDSSR
jgi:hypothetical protein